MKYRIMILTPPVPYYWERGASLRVHMVANGLTDMGNEVEIVTTHLGHDIKMKELKIYRALRIPFINKVNLGFSFIRILLDFLILFRAFTLLLKKKTDLIIAESGEAAFWGVILKKLFNIPLVYDMHNSFEETIAINNLNFPVRLANLIDLHLYKNSDYIIANADFVKEDVLRLHPTENIITIFDRIVDKDIHPQNDFPFMNDRYIVYVGNFAEYQGVDLLIKAFFEVQTKISDVKLVLIGPNFPDKLKTLVRSNDNIHYLGRLPVPLTNCVLKGATIAAFPANYFALGMKLIHYIQFGKAIVARDPQRYSSILENKKSVLFCKPDPQDMADKFLLLLRNDVIRKKLEAHVKLINETKFSFSALKKQLELVLNHCLKK